MDKERLLYLLHRYISDKTSWQEEEELFDRLELPENDRIITDFLKERWDDGPLKFTYRVTPGEDLEWDKMWARMQAATAKQPQEHPVKKK